MTDSEESEMLCRSGNTWDHPFLRTDIPLLFGSPIGPIVSIRGLLKRFRQEMSITLRVLLSMNVFSIPEEL
jgi:hypothetical protein